MKGSIGIIGGSIAGLTTAISLLNRGFNVEVFERSSKTLQGRGAGIGVSKDMLEQAIKANLLNSSIPQLPTLTRSFVTKDPTSPRQERTLIDKQPFSMIALNWQHIYTQLQSKFPQEFYHPGEPVKSVSQDNESARLETDQRTYYFDYVIGADGLNSKLRSNLFPQVTPDYANYIGWRGVCDDPLCTETTYFDSHGAIHLFTGGHIVLYKIPALDYAETGKTVINWVLYEYRPDVLPQELLVDKNGIQRSFSIPPGMLSMAQTDHINDLAVEKLPPEIAAIIRATPLPFAQAIYDLAVPEHVQGRFILLGDAAASLRPHVAAGAVKAIEGAIELAQALDVPVDDQSTSLNGWNELQKKKTQSLKNLTERFGEALVTASPDWSTMTPVTAQQWWESLMKGKAWYATSSNRLWGTQKTQGNDPTITPKDILDSDEQSSALHK